ncbi:MAG TPA: hypothetical protein VEJ47_20405 [Candidatus Eremiobacteraceae bacterium]|nr:hypothetical protein [Candidatus Eremiobacteraceae bacterium]
MSLAPPVVPPLAASWNFVGVPLALPAVVRASPSVVPSVFDVTGVRAAPGEIEVMMPQMDLPSQGTSFLGKLAYTASPTRNDTGLVRVN